MVAINSWSKRFAKWYAHARGSKYAAIVILCYAAAYITANAIHQFDPGLGYFNSGFSIEASTMTSVVGCSIEGIRDLLKYVVKLNECILANTQATRDMVAANRDMLSELKAR
jgi:low affinity Fe/Cu permease